MAPLLQQAAARAARYLNHLGARPVFPSPAALGRLAETGALPCPMTQLTPSRFWSYWMRSKGLRR